MQSTSLEAYRNLGQKEKLLSELNTPIVASYIEQWKEKRRLAQEKAEQLLQETLGKEVYEQLQKTKSLVFTANQIDYKITINGKIFRKTNNEWRELCVIHPKFLPLPDFIVALLFNIRKHDFPLKRR